MLKTLYARLAAVLVALFVVIGVIHVAISSSVIERYWQELTQHFNRDLATRLLMDGKLVVDGRLDQDALKATFDAYMEINPSIEIYLLDKVGNILSFSAEPGKVMLNKVDVQPIHDFLKGDSLPVLGDDPSSGLRRKTFSAAKVYSDGEHQGYLYVVLRGKNYDTAEQQLKDTYVWRLSAWAVLGSLGFGLLAGLLLFHLLTRRLQRLHRTMEQFAGSDFSHYEPCFSGVKAAKDEIDELGGLYDDMAERIVSQLDQLKSQDRLRRELIAQISHDLRTPLAVVHGYLETLHMKGGELDTANREDYLDSALHQSSRLKGMVEDLFELAHLEARDTCVQSEPFALPELLQDVVMKFKLEADKRDITLYMDPPSVVPFVMADIALTERVLDNLIGNALDHTPTGGTVRLGLNNGEKTVRVSVSDSGEGIPAEELDRIFEPFYRSKHKKDKRKGHAGLGLAIAKKIVELQQGHLSADNSVEGGAIFTFALPVAEQ
ncbi:MAG: HAMP domain-containing histidine kinase [Chromatiales bacterium]|nr:HAMP domain-containing histidine kinase [Chromatiales bacterium]